MYGMFTSVADFARVIVFNVFVNYSAICGSLSTGILYTHAILQKVLIAASECFAARSELLLGEPLFSLPHFDLILRDI